MRRSACLALRYGKGTLHDSSVRGEASLAFLHCRIFGRKTGFHPRLREGGHFPENALRRSPPRARGPHAAADAAEQPQRAAGPLRREHAQPKLDAALERIDQRMGAREQPQDPIVEAAKPWHLQKLRSRRLEDEGGDAEAE